MTRRKETALAHPVAPSKWASIRQAERVSYGGAVATPPRANWKAGLTPGWVAMQMGHSPEMFFRVYSRWIQGADQGAERRKLDAFLGDKTGTENGTGTAN